MQPENASERATEVTQTNQYSRRKNEWVRLVLCGLACEIVVAIIWILLDNNSIHLLPSSSLGVSRLDISSIAQELFASTITINGIILGFFGVTMSGYLEWNTRKKEAIDARILETTGEENEKEMMKREALGHVRRNIVKYAQLFMKVSILLMLLQTAAFVLTYGSGIIVILDIMVNISALLTISVGLYPILIELYNIF